MIESFFSVYDNPNYSLVESCFLDSDDLPLNRVIQSIKQKSVNTNFPVLGYIWVIDVGANNKMHFLHKTEAFSFHRFWIMLLVFEQLLLSKIQGLNYHYR